PAKAFTVTNSGTGAGTLTGATVAGAGFAIAPGGDDCAGETLQPTDSCTVEVVFAPTAAGSHTGSLEVAGASPASAALSGTGEPAPTPPSPEPTPQPTPPAPQPLPPAPPSASIAGKPSAPHVGDAEGDVPLGIACDSPAGTPCQVTLELLGGRWSGKV